MRGFQLFQRASLPNGALRAKGASLNGHGEKLSKASRRPRILLVVTLTLLFSLVFLNLLGVVSNYTLSLVGKYLSLALFAVSLDIIWGYTGILSLMHAIFFGLGAYCMGMYLMLEGSGQGVYGEKIPDFMVWNRVQHLPLFWKPFHSFGFSIAAALWVPALFALAVGFFTFRRRVRGTYFAILSQAIAFVFWLLLNRNEMMLGGTNGLTDFKLLLSFPLQSPAVQRVLFAVTAAILTLTLFFLYKLVHSQFGLILRGLRDNERRLEALGYNASAFKMAVFALGGALAGLSGVLYVSQVGIITPSQVGVLPSLEVVIWVAFGGRGTLFGAALGAVAINALRSTLTAAYPEIWPLLLGGLFVVVTLFFPEGLVGLVRRRKRKAPAALRSLALWRKAPAEVKA